MSGADAPLLAVEGVGLVRGGRRVLDGVSFDVGSGEIVALIGPSGAGKTTLLECLVGLRRADAGVVRHRGRPLTRFGERCATFSFDDFEVRPAP